MESSICAGESADGCHLHTYPVVSFCGRARRTDLMAVMCMCRFGLGKVHQEVSEAPVRDVDTEGEEPTEPLPLELPDDFTKPEYRWALFRNHLELS